MNFKLSAKIELVLVVLIIYIITFPLMQPFYSAGLDSSYVWALNYLFRHDYSILKEIIYPFGPLTLLKNPTIEGYNFEIFLLFYSVIKVCFIYLFITTFSSFESENRYLFYFLALVISSLIFIDFFLFGIVFILSYRYILNPKISHIIIAASLAFIGISIKSSIGILSYSVLFICFIEVAVLRKNIKELAIFAIVIFMAVIFWGLIILNGFGTIVNYLVAVARLSFGFSSALVINSDNNWIVLTLFIISVLLPAIIVREKNPRMAIFLLMPALFAAWKHGFSRQDLSHNMLLLSYLFLYWGLIISVNKTLRKQMLLLGIISISLYNINSANIFDYSPKRVEINGINNFTKGVINFNATKKELIARSMEDVSSSRLPAETKNMIGNASVDAYPWELSYFAADEYLNWKPRKTLQSGSYAQWLDKLNSEDFNRENGPVYIIFHYVKDKWGGDFGSIDERYLLNDNPLTIHNLFNYYNIVQKTPDFILLKKNNHDQFADVTCDSLKKTTWNKWIEVNYIESELQRIKVFSESGFKGKVRSFLFKDDLYFVDYMLEGGNVLTYRYVPANAIDGIWLNPLIRHPSSDRKESKVVKVRFRCGNESLHKKDLKYQFESTSLNVSLAQKDTLHTVAESIFDKKKSEYDTLLFVIEKVKTNIADSLQHSLSNPAMPDDDIIEIPSQQYTELTIISLDTIWSKLDTTYKKIIVESGIRYTHPNNKIMQVVSVSGSSDDLINGIWFSETYENECGYSYLITELNRKDQASGLLKNYISNMGMNSSYIEDYTLSFKASRE